MEDLLTNLLIRVLTKVEQELSEHARNLPDKFGDGYRECAE
ncbi:MULTISPECIES: hypothetical protein [unclassified Planococcus (in: firmicutes)]|nr:MULTISPECIES: hypothetical protein [unclassified Planococcus (in: firmicutes)]